MVIEVSKSLLKNASSPIDFSTLPASKVTEVSEVTLWNAPLPIEVTLFGMVIEVSEVLKNAVRPIDFSTLSASKVTEVSDLAFENA